MQAHDNTATLLTGAIVLALLTIVSVGLGRSTYTVAKSVHPYDPPPSKLFVAPSKFLLEAWRERLERSGR
jgi:hypothetical protein